MDERIRARTARGRAADDLPVEIVERKGVGHPDSVCDALAEELSRRLCRYYRDAFGLVLHHNVDKVLLCGGAARPAFGGGTVTKPMEIYLAGRATAAYGGQAIPVHDIAIASAREWLAENLRGIDVARHVAIHSVVKPGSTELVELFARAARSGIRHANDTSCGVGFAPLTRLESVVYEVERQLNSAAFKSAHPETGEDVKVMGLRRGNAISLTVSCAMVGRELANLDAYRAAVADVAAAATATAQRAASGAVEVAVNAADDYAAGSVYLTVTGTSAEAGDDGEAGRGNRVNGLITPYRPMTMESAAGKNPISHVGKIYNVAAGLIANEIVEALPEVSQVECRLVSRIGRPVSQPEAVDIELRVRTGSVDRRIRRAAERVAMQRLSALDELADGLIAGDVAIDRWPLGYPAAEATWRDARRRLLAEISEEARLVARSTGRSQYASRVMAALGRVPRHAFVPPRERPAAYANVPLPIAYSQTISQPFIVALMTELLDLTPRSRVLEIGTGSGYQCAVLAELADRVYSIEIVEPLLKAAAGVLAELGYENVEVRAGDGYAGWPDAAPFDAIIVTAGAREVPPPLLAQLAPGGRMVIPVGDGLRGQELLLIEKDASGVVRRRDVLAVAFVPFTRAD
jgi:S-adenosylmethionine synthetase